uniref:Uncharacterized protein n=1 Tax=Xenopus tropicalis TaxID=8364 RepID=A0A6I8SNB3_XENTR
VKSSCPPKTGPPIAPIQSLLEGGNSHQPLKGAQCASAVTGFYIENSRTSLPTKSRGDFVLPSEADAYFHLLKDYVINDFLKKDSCRKIADKYLLAMVLIYFKRAHLKPCEYGRLNFFRALYLAHDMGEDPDNAKLNILLFRRRKTLVNFLQLLPKAHGNILILQAGAVTGWTRHGQDGAGVDQTGTGRSGRRPDGNRTEAGKRSEEQGAKTGTRQGARKQENKAKEQRREETRQRSQNRKQMLGAGQEPVGPGIKPQQSLTKQL